MLSAGAMPDVLCSSLDCDSCCLHVAVLTPAVLVVSVLQSCVRSDPAHLLSSLFAPVPGATAPFAALLLPTEPAGCS